MYSLTFSFQRYSPPPQLKFKTPLCSCPHPCTSYDQTTTDFSLEHIWCTIYQIFFFCSMLCMHFDCTHPAEHASFIYSKPSQVLCCQKPCNIVVYKINTIQSILHSEGDDLCYQQRQKFSELCSDHSYSSNYTFRIFSSTANLVSKVTEAI